MGLHIRSPNKANKANKDIRPQIDPLAVNEKTAAELLGLSPYCCPHRPAFEWYALFWN